MTNNKNRCSSVLVVTILMLWPAFLWALPGPADAVVPGQQMKLEASIAARDGGRLEVTAADRSKFVVLLSEGTRILERKSNPFRGAKMFRPDQLFTGLQIEVKGRGDSTGALLAEEIRLREDDLWVAQSIHLRVVPVEARLGETEDRVARSEERAKEISGQVDELAAVSNAARGGAKAAQETADAAQQSANAAMDTAQGAKAGVRAANERISSLDEFDVLSEVTVQFKVNSSLLSREAASSLDGVASAAENAKGYIIEVTGYTSADGAPDYNRRLSERRANAVIRHLVENCGIPLRRIVTPFGYGESQPVADNGTRTGRAQNRRVEVRMLISKAHSDKIGVSAGLRAPEN